MGQFIEKEIKDVVPEAYLPFAGYVIQTRALPDARDCLKTGGRYILWSQYKEKNTFDKARVKASNTVGAIMKWNPHGDAGIYGSLVRLAKPFAMRYCLEDTKGNVGTMTLGDDHTAARYLEIRSAKLASEFTNLVEKNTVDLWKENYQQTDIYPAVFPTLFPNFVNGNTGIGVGCSSSIPQYNLREVIDSCKKLVYNPDLPYDDIYVAPDFATGATIVNGDEIKEALRVGYGPSIRFRAKFEYDASERAIHIKELPYQVFTTRVMREIQQAIDEGHILAIEEFFDGTDRTCGDYGTDIQIVLKKGASADRVIRQLYKYTALQSTYTVSCLMLKDGLIPQYYGQKEMMLSYLSHMENCLRKAYEFDLRKLQERINILKGYIIILKDIDNVIDIIKKAKDASAARLALEKTYELNEDQSKAILELKLQRLTSMEVKKIKNELEEKETEASRIEFILTNEEEFKKIVTAELDRLYIEYGDERRTEIIGFWAEEDEEPTEIKPLTISLTNQNNLIISERSDLYTQRRGSVGAKFKLNEGERVISSIQAESIDTMLLFSDKGNYYSCDISKIPCEDNIAIEAVVKLGKGEHICALTSFNKKESKKNIIFITSNGLLKKSELTEYSTKRQVGTKALNLDSSDSIVAVLFTDDDPIAMMSAGGQFVKVNTKDIRPLGRISAGIKGMKLNEGDKVVSARIITEKVEEFVCIASNSLIKRVKASDFPTQQTNTKGKRISKVKEGSEMVDFIPLITEKEIVVSSTRSQVKLKKEDINLLATSALGTKAMKLANDATVIGLEAF